MNVFVDMHGKVDKLISSIPFENVLRIEEIEQEQQTLMKRVGLSVFVHQEEIIFHDFYDPMACYIENSNNQDLRLKMDCKLKDEDNGQINVNIRYGLFCTSIFFLTSADFIMQGGCHS
jgi:hypothetical protein